MRYAIDFYSGYIEEVLSTIGSRDVTLVERFLRLGDHTKMALGLPDEMMGGWEQSVERLLMAPPKKLETLADSVAVASLLVDTGQRRFRTFCDDVEGAAVTDVFTALGQPAWAQDLLDSAIGGLRSSDRRLRWGFLDVKQVDALLTGVFGDDSFRAPKTAAIAGRLSTYARHEAERALLEVGIETQNSVSHNIDYLVIGSKGTGGTKHDKVQALQGAGHTITVLDEEGFDRLVHAPKPPPAEWDAGRRELYEKFVCALRHVWAFELDLYAITYEYDPANDLL